MDLTAFVTALQSSLGAHLPKILGAIAILALGWLLAVAARAPPKTTKSSGPVP